MMEYDTIHSTFVIDENYVSTVLGYIQSKFEKLKTSDLIFVFYEMLIYNDIKIEEFNIILQKFINFDAKTEEDTYPLFDEKDTSDKYYDECYSEMLYVVSILSEIKKIVVYDSYSIDERSKDIYFIKRTYNAKELISSRKNVIEFREYVNYPCVIYKSKEFPDTMIIIAETVPRV